MDQVVYKFSEFQLDAAQRVLTRNKEMIALPRKAIDVLLFFVQNRGRVLEKEELMKALWPDTFVEDSNLTHNIFVLRKALGDDRNGKRFIQTIPRRGYRFVAEVKEVPASASHTNQTVEHRDNGAGDQTLTANEYIAGKNISTIPATAIQPAKPHRDGSTLQKNAGLLRLRYLFAMLLFLCIGYGSYFLYQEFANLSRLRDPKINTRTAFLYASRSMDHSDIVVPGNEPFNLSFDVPSGTDSVSFKVMVINEAGTVKFSTQLSPA